MASGDEEKAIVANGGAPNGHFLNCLGNSVRHLMPLSPTWRARDVGEADPPTPMGTGPLFGSEGGGGCTKSGSRRYMRAVFTQLQAALMRKTLLLLVCVY